MFMNEVLMSAFKQKDMRLKPETMIIRKESGRKPQRREHNWHYSDRPGPQTIVPMIEASVFPELNAAIHFC